DRRHLHEPDHLGDELLEVGVAAYELGFRELVLEVVDELSRIVAEQDGADPLLGRGDEDRAEPTLADRETDRDAIPAPAKSLRSHAENLIRGFIKTAVRVESSPIDGRGDGPVSREFATDAA